jgi:hypothetical protein
MCGRHVDLHRYMFAMTMMMKVDVGSKKMWEKAIHLTIEDICHLSFP